jgi:RNA binding activity-knot of a chromodomain
MDTMASSDGNASGSSTQQPLQIHDRCHVQWRGGQQYLPAVIVERRPHRDSATRSKRKRRTGGGDIGVDIDSLPADAIDYYVHYVDHDRCVRAYIRLNESHLFIRLNASRLFY